MNECNCREAPLRWRGSARENECNKRTVWQVVPEPQSRQETVEVVRVVLRERVQQHTVERMVDTSIPQIGEGSVAVVERFPQEPISERICEQSEVIEVTETASQDRNLQPTVTQILLDLVEDVKFVPQKRISERMCEQLSVIEVPKNSSQESVEIDKIIPQEQSSERTREQIGVIEVPETSSQDWSLLRTMESVLGDFVEVEKTIPQMRISERMYEGIEVIEVPTNR